MNLFAALEWLSQNPGKELLATRTGVLDFKVRRNASGGFESYTLPNSYHTWCKWSPDLDASREYSFSIPERKLPELPVGDAWERDQDGGLYGIRAANGSVWPAISNNHEQYRANLMRYQALVAEFETRSK